MKEVVNEILAAEKACDQILQEARKKALNIKQESEKEAATLIAAAHDEARETINTAITRSRERALQERGNAFKAISTYKTELLSKNSHKIDTLVDEIRDILLAVPTKQELSHR